MFVSDIADAHSFTGTRETWSCSLRRIPGEEHLPSLEILTSGHMRQGFDVVVDHVLGYVARRKYLDTSVKHVYLSVSIGKCSLID